MGTGDNGMSWFHTEIIRDLILCFTQNFKFHTETKFAGRREKQSTVFSCQRDGHTNLNAKSLVLLAIVLCKQKRGVLKVNNELIK